MTTNKITISIQHHTIEEFEQYSIEEWNNKRNKIRDEDLCPCDDHPAEQCETCRGACTCHFKQPSIVKREIK